MSRPNLGYLLVLAGAVVLLVISAGRSWREASPWTGLQTEQRAGGLVTVTVVPGSPAHQAGIEDGDGIVEIAGRPVASKLVADDLLAQVEPGRAVGLQLLRSGRNEPVQMITAAIVRWRWNRVAAAAVAFLFCLGGVAVTLRPRRNAAVGVYAAWCVAGALVLGTSWSSSGEGIDWLLFWADRGARLLFPALWLHLVLALRHPTRAQRRWLPVVYAPAVALLLAELHLVGLGGALRTRDPVALVDLLQTRFEMAWFAGGMIAGLALLVHASLARRHLWERARARWLLVGSAIGLAPFLLVIAAPLVAGWGPSRFAWAALLPLAVVPLVFTMAVIEYRLMDLALFGRRALAISATLGMSLVLFLGLLKLAEWLVPPLMEPAGLVPILVAAVITAALAPAIRAGSRDIVGRLYYRRRYNFRRALERVARELNAEQELSRLSRVLEQRISEALNASPVWLLLAGDDGRLIDPVNRQPVHARVPESTASRLSEGLPVALADIPSAPGQLPMLHRSSVQILIPLRVKGSLIAVLAVGPRSGGGLLDSDDLDLLRSVAAHASAAVAGAISLDQLRDQVDLVQRLQARTEALIESSPIGMAVVDTRGDIRHWNPALEVLLGRDRDATLGRPYTEALPAPLHGFVHQALKLDVGSASVRAYRVRIVSGSGGEERQINLAASPLRGPGGIDGLLLSLDDVTEQAHLEEQLIQQDRLASVGMLAAGVAHEVNTPLTGISSYAQILLQETDANDPRRPMLEKVVTQVDRASRIARGLLSISRPVPSDDVAYGPVDLRDLAEETLGLLAPQLRKAGVVVRGDWAPHAVVADADRARIQQVLMNLILNALDAVGGGGTVTLRTRFDRSDRPTIEVEDDGVGIPEGLRDRIFDPFFTTKTRGRGTGLGLSISYAIVREHGGALVVDSTPGRGTIMRMMLPAAVREVASRRAG